MPGGYACVAHDCCNSTESRAQADRVIHLHTFPLENKQLTTQWVIATKLAGFKPTKSDHLCSDHFTKEDYVFSNSSRLKPGAVPSVFNFPAHLTKDVPKKRKNPCDHYKQPLSTTKQSDPTPPSPKKPKGSPSKEELKKLIAEQKTKIKTLQQKLRRRDKKIETQSQFISDLKAKNLIDDDIANILDENFSGLTGAIIQNQFKNKGRDPRGRRHNDEVKKFALTLHFYSPRAYDYLRKVFDFPHPKSLYVWTSSVDCEPGLFLDVFERFWHFLTNLF